jgi:transcriptional regulator with XRE-family HTH domain
VIGACRRRDTALIIAVLGSHWISQIQITGLTGIPQGRLSEYKTGKREPTMNTLEDFANGLEIPEEARRALGLARRARRRGTQQAFLPSQRRCLTCSPWRGWPDH